MIQQPEKSVQRLRRRCVNRSFEYLAFTRGRVLGTDLVRTLKQEIHMSFRSALLASAAILTAGTAFAADLPARVAAPAPYIAAPIFTWTGFYVGLNAGAGFNNKNNGFIAGPGFTGPTAITVVGGG